MKIRIDEVGSILDDQIVRALSFGGKPLISDYENRIVKSITFNPLNIKEITSSEDSPYYVPYGESIDGGFYPHSVDHWAEQGKNPEDYRDVHDFYAKLGVAQETMAAFRNTYTQGKKFSFLARSLNRIVEESNIPEEEIYIDLQKSKFIVNGDIGRFFISDNIFRHFITDLPEINNFFIRTS